MVRHLEATAVDDTLDLFALLMATRLFSPARPGSAEQRLALPRLEKASKTVARAGAALTIGLILLGLWSAVERVAPRAVVVDAIAVVEELGPAGHTLRTPKMHSNYYVTLRANMTV